MSLANPHNDPADFVCAYRPNYDFWAGTRILTERLPHFPPYWRARLESRANMNLDGLIAGLQDSMRQYEQENR